MLFNSLAFAVFLPIVFLLYWAIPQKYRYIVLLIASYYFYMSWNVKYVVLILFTTAVSYAAALGMEKLHKKSTKRLLMIGAVGASLLVLFFFKYFDFAQNTIIRVLQSFAIELHPVTLTLMLPVGISFYTFQTLSYAIDVYKGEVKAERNFFKYAAFVSFFPQLVAGPIERTGNLLPQIDCEHTFTYEKGAYGMRLMAWGFFKKLVIADNLAVFVDAVFEDVAAYHGFALVLAVSFFTLQIYCDFSGYSDIAIGVAKLFDINLMTNFKSPYFSTSIKEFWRRWHISLSSWFRDYVYIPLGGNRVSKGRNMFNLLATFSLSGLWHGAAFTYIVWGGLHGALQCVENILFPRKKLEQKRDLVWWLKVAVVFCLVSAAWCFFRAGSCKEALYVFAHMTDGLRNPLSYINVGVHAFDMTSLKFMVLPIMLLAIYDYVALDKDPIQCIGKMPTVARKILYVVFLLLLLLLASFNSQEFVYFQF